MPLLSALITGGARVAVLAAFYGDDARPRHQRGLARELGLPLRSVQRELKLLVSAGLVTPLSGPRVTAHRTTGSEAYGRLYRADATSPIYVELRRIVMQEYGAASVLRAGLPELVRLAWMSGAYVSGRLRSSEPIEVAVISGAPKRLLVADVRKLEPRVGRRLTPVVMSSQEWVSRLDKRETVVRRLRASPKLWIRGDMRRLRIAEEDVRSTRATIRAALAGDDDLTDEWDEDFDPWAGLPAP